MENLNEDDFVMEPCGHDHVPDIKRVLAEYKPNDTLILYHFPSEVMRRQFKAMQAFTDPMERSKKMLEFSKSIEKDLTEVMCGRGIDLIQIVANIIADTGIPLMVFLQAYEHVKQTREYERMRESMMKDMQKDADNAIKDLLK